MKALAYSEGAQDAEPLFDPFMKFDFWTRMMPLITDPSVVDPLHSTRLRRQKTAQLSQTAHRSAKTNLRSSLAPSEPLIIPNFQGSEEILPCMLGAEWMYLTWRPEANAAPSASPLIRDAGRRTRAAASRGRRIGCNPSLTQWATLDAVRRRGCTRCSRTR
jgi:hypothetical protein